MKIALVSDWYFPHIGGVESQMRDLAHALIRRGHEVRIITPTRGPVIHDGLRIDRVEVPIIRRWGIAYDRTALGPLEALFRRERFDRIHAHGLWSPFAIMATYVARQLGIPGVITNHSVLGESGVALFRALDRRWGWSRWPDVISAVSTLTVEETARAAGREVTLLPNCIAADEWAVAREPGPVTQIASVLRFSTRKSPVDLVRAIPRILDRLPRERWPRFVIAGDGVHRRRLEREAERGGWAPAVRFLGFVPRAELRRVLAASQLFVHPTVKEAFGIVIAEARAAGLPVVAMRASGARDLISDGVNGVLAGDHREWERQIVHLVLDDALRARMTAAAPVGLERYAVERVTNEHLDVYARAAGDTLVRRAG